VKTHKHVLILIFNFSIDCEKSGISIYLLNLKRIG
jgi:hypothetical protein